MLEGLKTREARYPLNIAHRYRLRPFILDLNPIAIAPRIFSLKTGQSRQQVVHLEVVGSGNRRQTLTQVLLDLYLSPLTRLCLMLRRLVIHRIARFPHQPIVRSRRTWPIKDHFPLQKPYPRSETRCTFLRATRPLTSPIYGNTIITLRRRLLRPLPRSRLTGIYAIPATKRSRGRQAYGSTVTLIRGRSLSDVPTQVVGRHSVSEVI